MLDKASRSDSGEPGKGAGVAVGSTVGVALSGVVGVAAGRVAPAIGVADSAPAPVVGLGAAVVLSALDIEPAAAPVDVAEEV